MLDPISHTEAWIDQFVIGMNLCPFAKKPFKTGKIKFVLPGSTEANAIGALTIKESIFLQDEEGNFDTTIIILPNGYQDFYAYLDLVEQLNDALVENDLEGIVQIASFHPMYQFGGTHLNDAENFTNRAPYPLIHLLKEADLDDAIEKYPNTMDIPTNNIKTMNNFGADKLKQLLDDLKR